MLRNEVITRFGLPYNRVELLHTLICTTTRLRQMLVHLDNDSY